MLGRFGRIAPPAALYGLLWGALTVLALLLAPPFQLVGDLPLLAGDFLALNLLFPFQLVRADLLMRLDLLKGFAKILLGLHVGLGAAKEITEHLARAR